MVAKLSIAVILALCSGVIMVMSRHTPELILTVRGNDELGIKLELPYSKESPADVVITNNGNHHLLAYKIRWEGIKYSGEVVERESVKYHPLALLEKNPNKRRELLISNPLLAPRTKWFVGLGRENWQVTGKIPPLDDVGRDPELFPDLREYKQINVTLDAAILEDEKVVGRDPNAFGKEVKTLISEYLDASKDLNK